MSRNLLHKSKLEKFKEFLKAQGFVYRPGRGDWQILQVRLTTATVYNDEQWQCIFDRITAPEHYTVAKPLESLVMQFIAEEQRAKAIARAPWKFCKKCKTEIKSPTGYCYDCYKGHTFTASPYGLINANPDFKFVPSERR